MQVAAYWRRQSNEADSLMLSTHHELKQKAAFFKWKNVMKASKNIDVIKPQSRAALEHEPTPAIKNVQKTLDWLYTFDK